jgi:hypothetical protein
MQSGVRLVHGRRLVTAQCTSSSCGMARHSPMFRWLIGDEVLTYTFYS